MVKPMSKGQILFSKNYKNQAQELLHFGDNSDDLHFPAVPHSFNNQRMSLTNFKSK